MIKDGEAKPQKTFCDLCGKIASQIVGERVLCAEHTAMAKSAAEEQSLKAAPLTMADKHR